MADSRSDSPTCRRVVLAFLDFLNSVQPAPGVDVEAISVVKDCLQEIFRLNVSTTDEEIQPGMLLELFSSSEHAENSKFRSVLGPSPVENTSCTTSGSQQIEDSSHLMVDDLIGDTHLVEGDLKDQLMGKFFAALDKINFFKSSAGIEDHAQIAKATQLFSDAVQDMEYSQGQIINLSNIAETFKLRGNKSMQAKSYSDAIELYTCAIALSEKNAVYYGNRAAAFTEIHKYYEAIQDCLKAIEIDPNYSKAYSRLGLAYFAQGNYREALEKGFLKALQLDPNNDSVKANIRAAQQKLAEQHQRQGYQNTGSRREQASTRRSATWTNLGPMFSSGSMSTSIPPEFANLFRTSAESAGPTTSSEPSPFNMPTPAEFTNLFRNMGSTVNESRPSGNPEGEEREPVHINFTTGDNTSFSFESAPREVSDVVRSAMAMFGSQSGSQQNMPGRGNGQS